ncbi:transporter substrate-binding domain-containing protein [Mesorhizobium sp. CO1-1-8]|uniref:transporter substrate-binding domain-containing protein n=1 Tax=Mesorhizobium sp. CO1-1-8 TaxID=2876631 RepID=UPI001CD1553E|nr:transporter substrate-binding domain-containing protein [Mesorhizobium sp. CO1-1-8]MBZ9772496.1 transporter substrate-binding domain-containing protein [Mesorhizobium sp. CO1-1-8]
MKKLAVVVSLIAAVFGAAGPSSAADDVIRFGVAAEPYAPFSVKDASGTWQGWEIDLMNAVCTEMKAKCEIVDIAWDGIIPALLAKKFDVIWSSMSITDKRKEVIDFTDKYYYSPNVLVGAKADTRQFDVTKPDTFKGVTVAAQSASLQATYMQDKFNGIADVRVYPTLDDEIADIQAGRVDLMAAAGIQIQDFLKKPEGQAYEIKVTLPHEKMFGYGDGGGVRKEDTALRDRLNAALKAVKASGEYDTITKRYFDFDIYGD